MALVLLAAPVGAKATHNRYPNELPGFKFYHQYFPTLQPFVSDSKLVATVFGSTTKIELDRWTIWPMFVGEGGTVNGRAWAHNIVGLLARVDLHPRERVSMLGVKFPRTFKHTVGFVSEINVSCDIYTDRYGLEYWVYAEDSAVRKRGDLMKIVYGPSERLARRIMGS